MATSNLQEPISPDAKPPRQESELSASGETRYPGSHVEAAHNRNEVSQGNLRKQILERVEAIDSGQAPAVDPEILKEARGATVSETGGQQAPKAELQRFLKMLQEGIDDPYSALHEVLSAANDGPKGRPLN